MPHDNTRSGPCPFCGSDALFDGVIGSSDACVYVQPAGLKIARQLLAGVTFEAGHPTRACRDCGHVWAQRDPAKRSNMGARWGRPGGA